MSTWNFTPFVYLSEMLRQNLVSVWWCQIRWKISASFSPLELILSTLQIILCLLLFYQVFKILSLLFPIAHKFVAIMDKQLLYFNFCIQNHNKQADNRIIYKNPRLLVSPLIGSEQDRMVFVIKITNKSVESTVNFTRCNEFPFHQGASAKSAPIFYMRWVGPPCLNWNGKRIIHSN